MKREAYWKANYFVDLADTPPPCTPVKCIAVPCQTAVSGWTMVGIAVIGLALNSVKFVRDLWKP